MITVSCQFHPNETFGEFQRRWDLVRPAKKGRGGTGAGRHGTLEVN